ncbi:MAG: hypothetical protein ABQ298_08400 [Puniceicoccaceae bacterium]
MKTLLKLLSYLALLLVVVPPIFYLAGSIEKPTMSNLMLAGTLVWFATVPFWMGRKRTS